MNPPLGAAKYISFLQGAVSLKRLGNTGLALQKRMTMYLHSWRTSMKTVVN